MKLKCPKQTLLSTVCILMQVWSLGSGRNSRVHREEFNCWTVANERKRKFRSTESLSLASKVHVSTTMRGKIVYSSVIPGIRFDSRSTIKASYGSFLSKRRSLILALSDYYKPTSARKSNQSTEVLRSFGAHSFRCNRVAFSWWHRSHHCMLNKLHTSIDFSESESLLKGVTGVSSLAQSERCWGWHENWLQPVAESLNSFASCKISGWILVIPLARVVISVSSSLVPEVIERERDGFVWEVVEDVDAEEILPGGEQHSWGGAIDDEQEQICQGASRKEEQAVGAQCVGGGRWWTTGGAHELQVQTKPSPVLQ